MPPKEAQHPLSLRLQEQVQPVQLFIFSGLGATQGATQPILNAHPCGVGVGVNPGVAVGTGVAVGYCANASPGNTNRARRNTNPTKIPAISAFLPFAFPAVTTHFIITDLWN